MIDETLEAALRARERWDNHPEQQPRLLCHMGGIDKNSKGAAAWAALTIATAAGIPQTYTIAKLCKVGNLPRPALYKLMNKAMRPALELPREALEFLGLHQCDTASELSRAVARTMREAGYHNDDYEGSLEWQRMLDFG